MMLAMGDEVAHDSFLWNDDQSWGFPILQVEEDGDKILIDRGKILTGMEVPAQQEEAAEKLNEPPPPKGKKRMTGKRGGADKVNGGKGGGGGGGGGESDEHELHIWTERERRKKMRNMFASLHALIPHLHPRADKSTTVDEAVVYIKKLQLTLENLQKQKEILIKGGDANLTQSHLPIQSREAFLADQGATSEQPPVTLTSPNVLLSGPESRPFFRTWTSPNVVLNICGNDAHINVVCCPTKPRILTAILFVMDKYNLDLLSAQVSSDRTTRMYMVHARANVDPQLFTEVPFLVEETYKQAAAELMLWVNS